MTETPPRVHRLRRLSDEEIALWTEVARTVSRRRGASLPPASKPPVPPLSPPAAVAAAPASKTRPVKPRQPPLAPLDRRLLRALTRGRAAVDAALDLHGLTEAEAHRALRGFLRHSQSQGARVVIVVTGKGDLAAEPGGPFARERGVLRRLAPHWLRAPDLRSIVLGFEEAGRTHGGSGALYVRLRRPG